MLQAALLEALQRYFSFRAILVAIVSQNSFVLFLWGHRTIIAPYVAKWGITQMCLCEAKWGIAPFWGSANLPDKVSRAVGYRSDTILFEIVTFLIRKTLNHVTVIAENS